MNLPNLTLADFLPMLPAIIMVVAASVLLLSEVFLSATASRGYQAVLTVVAAVEGRDITSTRSWSSFAWVAPGAPTLARAT